MESTRGARKFEEDLMKPNVNMTNWRRIFSSHLFLAGGVVGIVSLGNFPACGIYTPAPDVQTDTPSPSHCS